MAATRSMVGCSIGKSGLLKLTVRSVVPGDADGRVKLPKCQEPYSADGSGVVPQLIQGNPMHMAQGLAEEAAADFDEFMGKIA